MKILAVETSTELCSVALLSGEDLLVEEVIAENRHSELLLPMIRRVLGRADARAASMNVFAFGQGPGSFTGIRIACGIVQGLAFGADKPVVPIPSLLALAAQAGAARVLAALDARMGEAYLAAYERRGADWECVIAPSLVDRSLLPHCRRASGPRSAAVSIATRGCARLTPAASARTSRASCRVRAPWQRSPRSMRHKVAP